LDIPKTGRKKLNLILISRVRVLLINNMGQCMTDLKGANDASSKSLTSTALTTVDGKL